MDTALALLERGHARRDLPRGHPHPAGLAGAAEARRRAPGPPERRAGRADRDHRHRARPRRLEDQPAQGARALRPPAHIPARGRPVAVPRRRGHRAHLALRRPPVGVARRPAAAAQGRGGRRRLDGHRHRLRCWRAPGSTCSSAAARPLRPTAAGRSRERGLPPGRRAGRDRAQDRPRDRVRRGRPGRAGRPVRSLPAAFGQIGARMGERSAVLVARRGSCRRSGRPRAPMSPSACARAPSPPGRPAHAREAIELGASVVVATARRRPAPPARARSSTPAARRSTRPTT